VLKIHNKQQSGRGYMQSETTTFKRSLGLLDGTMLVAGSMIGSGIFIVSADIARNVGSAGNLLLVWLISGLMTIIGAVSYGELSAMFPQAGGQYVYLRESYNRLIAFLYGWSFFAVIQTGTIAAVGVAFAKFTAYIFPVLGDQNILFTSRSFEVSAAQLVSIVLIVMLTYLNSRGVKGGKIVQTTFTVAKLLSLAALVIFGLLLGAKAGSTRRARHCFPRLPAWRCCLRWLYRWSVRCSPPMHGTASPSSLAKSKTRNAMSA